MRVYSLQLVHNGTYVLHAFTNFHTHCLFDTHAQGMAVLVCTQIVQTVGQSQSLRIGQAFAHLLDTPVDVAAVGINLVDDFTLQ